jgi:hypothetical protein
MKTEYTRDGDFLQINSVELGEEQARNRKTAQNKQNLP